MTKKQILGIIMLAVPVVALTIVMSMFTGIKIALVIMAIALTCASWILWAICLMSGESMIETLFGGEKEIPQCSCPSKKE